VFEEYSRTIARFGSEFNLFLQAPLEEIREASPILGEAVERMRGRRVIRKPGFDGQYGVIRVFEEGELARGRSVTPPSFPLCKRAAAPFKK
jgi:PHP family Zn ribbon phosphoesterase